ncbi:MAG: alcohol dehydrogenase family protein [Candidatus Puniceispirillaceae bacterium]
MSVFSYPSTMMAVVTTGNGGYDKLSYQSVPVRALRPGEILLRVLAAGMNNTEINTRLGWYSKTVTSSTDSLGEAQEQDPSHKADGGWNKATPFPIIQGTDCCAEIVAVHDSEDKARIGERVLVRACMRLRGFDSLETAWMASDFDGAFADYVIVPSSEAFAVDCDWEDAELATIPCAYATAETMLHRAACKANDKVFVTGASGGVGSAVVQLAKRRGAVVTALTRHDKMARLKEIGADYVIDRDQDVMSQCAEESFDLIVDNVAGPSFPDMLKLLVRGGRYASSGAIAGPVVSLDMRDMYLKDIQLIGTTAWDEPVFPNLIHYIETGQIKPLLAKRFALSDIAKAQEDFSKKTFVGNYVLIP